MTKCFILGFEELQINTVVIIYYPLFSEGGNFRGKCFFSVSVRFTIRSLRIYLSSYLPPSIPSRIQIHLRPTLVTGSPTPPPAKGYRENRQERPYREKKKSPRMVQSYLSYPFHVNTQTHTLQTFSFNASTPLPLLPQPVDPGDSYKRRVIRRKDCIALREERVAPALLPLLPPVSSQRLHKTRVNGSAIIPTPFSKRPPVERARDREKEGVGERERERGEI